MAFNPLKNRNIEAPVEQSPNTESNDSAENLVNPSINNSPTTEQKNQKTVNEEPKKSFDRPKFNISALDSTPLDLVLAFSGAEKISETLYEIYGQKISIKENKWYNTTAKRGHIKAISLLKHLTAIYEKLDEKENDKILFISACKQLTSIQEKIANENTSNLETKQEFKYEPSEAVKQAQAESEPKKKVDWKVLTAKLNQIPLDHVLENLGANPNEDGQRGKWKVYQTGHNVHVTGQKWIDWNSQFGGHGGISLLAYHLCIENHWNYKSKEDFDKAKWIAKQQMVKQFSADYDLDNPDLVIEEMAKEFKVPFCMPHKIPFKTDSVRKYLNEKRGLPMWIIDKQIKAGSLFAGFPSDWKEDPNLSNPDKLSDDRVWATFLSHNKNAAEMRAIGNVTEFAKIQAKGSDKEFGGFLIKAEKEALEKDADGNPQYNVVSCEAAIDTLSYHAFYPGRIVMSSMGVNFKLAVQTAIEALNGGARYHLAFDNDLAGNEATVNFRTTLMEEIGDEEYNKHIADNKIGYFELGIRCLIQTIKKGGTYYFDVKNNDTGRVAAKMFQDQLMKIVPKETVKDLVLKGKIKYANIAPTFAPNIDVEKEAQEAVNLLLSQKPFYLLLKQADDDEKPEITALRESFENAFKNAAGPLLEKFEKEGKVIYKKQALAKDWNEFLIIMKKDPKFQEKLANQETLFNHYSEELSETKKKGKHP